MFLAYIDPGSGSILIQVILASCIGGIAVFWSRNQAGSRAAHRRASSNTARLVFTTDSLPAN